MTTTKNLLPRSIALILLAAACCAGWAPRAEAGRAAQKPAYTVSLARVPSRAEASSLHKMVVLQTRGTGLKAVIKMDTPSRYQVLLRGFRTKAEALAAIKQARAYLPGAKLVLG